MGTIPGSGRSTGEGNGNPFQYSCLEKVPWTEGPGGLQTMGPQRVGHDRMIEHIEQSKKKKKKKKKQISTLKYYSYLKWVKTKLGVDD